MSSSSQGAWSTRIGELHVLEVWDLLRFYLFATVA